MFGFDADTSLGARDRAGRSGPRWCEGQGRGAVHSAFFAAVHWMRTSPLHRVRVYERAPARAQSLRLAFAKAKAKVIQEQTGPAKRTDVFLSYSHKNSEAADLFSRALLGQRPSLVVFRDTKSLRTGRDYRVQLDSAIRTSHRFLPLLSPDYVASKGCQDEFNSAWCIRDRDAPDLFFPVRINEGTLGDIRMEKLHYQSCMPPERQTIERVARLLISELPTDASDK